MVVCPQLEEYRIQPASGFAGLNNGDITFGETRIAKRPAGVTGALKILAESLEAGPDFAVRIAREHLNRAAERHPALRELSQLMKELLVLPEAQCVHRRELSAFCLRSSSFPLNTEFKMQTVAFNDG